MNELTIAKRLVGGTLLICAFIVCGSLVQLIPKLLTLYDWPQSVVANPLTIFLEIALGFGSLDEIIKHYTDFSLKRTLKEFFSVPSDGKEDEALAV